MSRNANRARSGQAVPPAPPSDGSGKLSKAQRNYLYENVDNSVETLRAAARIDKKRAGK